MRHHTKEEALVHEGMDFYPFQAFGGFFAVKDDTIFSMPMSSDGLRPLTEDMGQVTAPNLIFLKAINAFFDTNFKLEDFAGR